MRKFIAHFISGFVPYRHARRSVRHFIMNYGKWTTESDVQKMINECVSKLPKPASVAAVPVAPAPDMAAKDAKIELMEKYIAIKRRWLDICHGAPLLPADTNAYDLVFAIGATCHMATKLSAHKLRKFSNPFDGTGGMQSGEFWSMPDVWRDSRFKEKIDSLCDGFKNYFNKKDLKFVSQWIDPNRDIPHRHVVNIRTHIRFLHLISTNVSPELQMPDIQARMQRRGKNLIDSIEKSKKILICWTHQIGDQRAQLDATVPDKDIIDAIKKLKKKWPDKQFDMVFFEHDGIKHEYEFDKIRVCDGAYRIRSNHFLNEPAYKYKAKYNDAWTEKSLMYTPVIDEALDNIHLTDTLADMHYYD